MTLTQLAQDVYDAYERSPGGSYPPDSIGAPPSVYLRQALSTSHDPSSGHCDCASCCACRNHCIAQEHATAGHMAYAQWHQEVGDAWFRLSAAVQTFRRSWGTT